MGRLTGLDAAEEMRNRAAFIEGLLRQKVFDHRELARVHHGVQEAMFQSIV